MNKRLIAMGISGKLRHVRNSFYNNIVPKLKQHAVKQMQLAAMKALEPEYSGEGKRPRRPHALKFMM